MTCRARLEAAGVGWVVLLWHDLADVLDRDAAGDVKADLVGGGLVAPDGSLTERGEEARRAALRLLAERQIAPCRVEALAGGDVVRWAALADAATPGPWEQAHQIGERQFVVTLKVRELAEDVGYALSEADTAFIAAARTAVPALCAEVARLRAALAAAPARMDAPAAQFLRDLADGLDDKADEMARRS